MDVILSTRYDPCYMKLIILNGPCGVGKSTLAKRLHADEPLSFLLDMDQQRRFISNWQDYKEERWEMTTSLAVGVLHAMLGIGRSVIVDRMTYLPSVIDQYYKIAKQYGADVHEIILWAPKEVVLQRAEDRGWVSQGVLTPERLGFFWDQLDVMKNQQSKAIIIQTGEKTPEQVYQEVAGLLN